MQETGLGWDPMYDRQLPWFTKAFVIYLVVVLLLAAARVIRLMWRMREFRTIEQGNANELISRFQFLWESCQAKVASLKSLSVLTILFSLLIFSWNTTTLLQGITMEKVTGAALLAGAMAQAFSNFSLGILVCAVLYIFAIVCDVILVRRKMLFLHSKSES